MGKRNEADSAGVEWSWGDSSILLPLAYEAKEWNALSVAFFLAEYSGAPVVTFHVKSDRDSSEKRASFLGRMETFASQLRVKYSVTEVDSRTADPSVSEIAKAIVLESGRIDCQAIVMAAHRESFFRELFGRISDKVVRDSRRMVILVETPHVGVTLPKKPKRILIPILRDQHDSSPYIVSAALTSTAAAPNSELVVARVVSLPPTTPLDAVEASKALGQLEKKFSYQVARSIRSLGRLFTPRILPVRDVGEDVAGYAEEIEADIMVLWSDKPSGFHRLLTREEYGVIRKTPCVALVVFPKKKFTREST